MNSQFFYKKEKIHSDYLKIGSIILIAMIIIVSSLHPDINNLRFYPHDFQFHYFKAGNADYTVSEFIDEEKLSIYAPLTSWVYAPFSFNLKTFYTYTLIIFFIVMGLLLAYLSKNWIAALFWLSCSAPYFFLGGVLAQGLATFLLIVFVYSRLKFRLILLCFGLLAHSWGFWLLLLYWLVELLVKTNWKEVMLGICGGTLFPAPVDPKIQPTNIFGVESISNLNLLGFNGLNRITWISIFRWIVMFPLLPFAFIGLWKNNRVWFWFSLLLFSGGFILLYWRIVESVMPFVVLGLTYYYQTSSKRMKMLLIIVAIGLTIIQYANYWYTIQNIHLSLTQMFFDLPCRIGVLQ